MKKLSFLIVLLMGAVAAFAAQDTVSMVTYFPMPYVSYNNLTVTKQLDVGLGTQCKWEMGNNSAAMCPLTATTVNLWGTLRLQNFTRLTQTTGTTLGSTSSNTGAQLKFQNNLRIHSFENAPMASVHTENLIVSGYDKLSVYSGRVSNPTYVMNQCTEGVHWEEITGKDNKTGVYLVCGQSTGSEEEDPDDSDECQPTQGETMQLKCSNGSYQTLEWDYNLCEYTHETPLVYDISCYFHDTQLEASGITAVYSRSYECEASGLPFPVTIYAVSNKGAQRTYTMTNGSHEIDLDVYGDCSYINYVCPAGQGCLYYEQTDKDQCRWNFYLQVSPNSGSGEIEDSAGCRFAFDVSTNSY